MIAQPRHEKPLARTRPPLRADAPVSRSMHSTKFDAHRWLERYLASHDGADPSDPLAGVPFN